MNRQPSESLCVVDASEPAPAASGAEGTRVPLPSFDQLYALYFGFTWRLMSHLGVSGAGRDDAVQDVWLTVYRRLPTFEGRSDVRTWLFAITANIARNRHRTESRRAKAPPPMHLHLESPLHNPELVREGREAWAQVQAFLETLDEQRRAIFVCSLLEDFSALETANATGVDPTIVYKRVRSLRHAFQLWLDRKPSEGGKTT